MIIKANNPMTEIRKDYRDRIALSDKRIQRCLYVFIGLISLALGMVGVILPLLPTTPFLLLSAACFSKSSTRLYHWLHTNRLFGEYLRRYRDKEGIPVEMKIGILTLLWATLASSAMLAIPAERWYVRIILLLIGIGVTIHILKIKTSEKRTRKQIESS